MAKKKIHATPSPPEADASYPLPSVNAAMIVAVVAFSVYVKSICPTIAGGDAGEGGVGKRFDAVVVPSNCLPLPPPHSPLPPPSKASSSLKVASLGRPTLPGIPSSPSSPTL